MVNFYFWLLECCFAVWSSGWSTAERSIVNYASTDLLSHQVSTLKTRMDHPLWSILLSFLNSFWGCRNFLPSPCHYVFIIIAFVEALKMKDGTFSSSSICPYLFLVYSPDMPSRLPIQDICAGLLTSVGTAIRYWFHYTLVAFAWLGVVPLTACKY